MLAFEGQNWNSNNIATAYVIDQLIGKSSAYAHGFPGRGMFNRAISNITQKHKFVEQAYSINAHFSDTGLIGMGIEGAGSHS